MYGRQTIFAFAFFLAAAGECVAQPANPSIDTLIRRLGSENFIEREQAQKKLEEIGEPALAPLQRSRDASDLETKRRVAYLIGVIEAPLFAKRIHLPKEVHLKLKDRPVDAAIGDLARQSGYSIELADPQGPLAKKKITLDTGKTTFWQAFDQLCDQAGLMERNELNEDYLTRDCAPPPEVHPPGRERTILLVNRDRWGKPFGTSYAGSIKIELWIEPDTEYKGTCFLFVVSPEPRLMGNTLVGLPKIEKAVDDQNRKVAFVESAPHLTPYQRQLHDQMTTGQNVGRMGSPLEGRRFGQIYLADRAGAKRLKELAGTLRFQAVSQPQVNPKAHAIEVPFRFKNVALR